MDDDRRAPRVARIELVQDLSQISSPVDGFLRRYRHRAKTVFTDGHRTDTYVADYVDRDPRRRDAVAVLPYVPAPPGEPVGQTQVLLRQQVRYPVHVVLGRPMLLETVAGIIEGDELPTRAAARELWEEAGFEVPARQIRMLGRAFFPSPGILTERIHILVAELAPDAFEQGPAEPPVTDGSAMEQGAELLALTLDDALALMDEDHLQPLFLADAKTEIALRRLQADLT